MAGDWIKMRGNLWDDPRVSAICDATDQPEAAVVGALYWLWATADQHTEDGLMPGLSLRQIDRKTGVQGFGQAVCDVGWLADHPEGVRILRFDEHNGASAKRRAGDAQRKANGRNVSASDADKSRTGSGQTADELRRIAELEEEKRREEQKKGVGEFSGDLAHVVGDAKPTTAGLMCKAMKQAGVIDVNPGHPDLLMLIEAGATVEEFAGAAKTAFEGEKGFAYALAVLKGQRQRAAKDAKTLHNGPAPPTESTYQREKREQIERASGGMLSQRKPEQGNPNVAALTLD